MIRKNYYLLNPDLTETGEQLANNAQYVLMKSMLIKTILNTII